VFLVNPPLIAIMLVLIPRLPASQATGGGRVDYRGALLVTAAIAALIFGLSTGQQHGFSGAETIKLVLVLGLAAMAAGQAWLAQVAAGSGYLPSVLPGLVLTALGIGLALPTASIAITSGVHGRDQGLAGALSPPASRPGRRSGWPSWPRPPRPGPRIRPGRWWPGTGCRS